MTNIQIFSKDVIPVYTTDEGNKVVLGRELHEKLSIKTPYTMWFPRMTEYGFVEGSDYFTDNKNVTREDGRKMPQVQTDHIMTLDMAKHIAMIQRTPQGMAIRQKLIDLEKESLLLKQNQQNTLEGLSPQLQYLIKLEQAQNRQAKEIAQVNERLDAACEALTLKVGVDWEQACQRVINAIAVKRGGSSQDYEDVWNEIYDAVDARGFDLKRRTANAQARSASYGISKTSVQKITRLKIISMSGDKKLICAFVDAVREKAAAAGVRTRKLDELQQTNGQTSLFEQG